MTKKQKRKLTTTIFTIILSIFAIERIYNCRDEFHVDAMDASHYGIAEAKLETRIKLKDFEYLYNVLEENYPYFEVNKRQNGIDWLGNKRKYKRLIRNTKSDAEFYAAMEKILGDLNDNHVNIFSGEDFKYYYKTTYPSWDYTLNNPYVMYRYSFNGDVESIELNEEPVLETKILAKDKLAYMKIKSMDHYHIDEDYPKIKSFLKEVENYEKLIIDIRGNDGDWDEYWEKVVELLIDKPLDISYYSFYKNVYRDSYNTYGIKGLTNVHQLDEKILEQFPKEVKTDFNLYKTNLIHIDPLDDINFNGKVYLLVDKNVFSSAEKFASFAKDTGFATLVGETTGGNRVFEKIPILYLPKSKFIIRFSRELGINADGTINMETKTIPHIQADPTPNEDFNKDECIQAVIKDGGSKDWK